MIFIIEDNVTSLLSALYFAFTKNIFPSEVFAEKYYQPRLDEETLKIENNLSGAQKVKDALIKYGEDYIVTDLKVCMLSAAKNRYTTAFTYAYRTIKEQKNIYRKLSDPAVAEFRYTIQKVYSERHRIKGFLRFSETQSGVLYACYSPDNDITELITPHFALRLRGIPFIIHDLSRGKIAVSDGEKVKYDYTEKKAILNLSNNEQKVLLLWKTYFGEVNIKDRKNLKLQNGYMPKRYRKFMPETYETNNDK